MCWNRDNPKGCRDYKVQYICPIASCNIAEENLTADTEDYLEDEYELTKEESEAETAGKELAGDDGTAE